MAQVAAAALPSVAAFRPCRAQGVRSSRKGSLAVRCQAAGAAQQDPLLLRVARGEDAERTPVWLMRQAGRYMAAFREYSDRLPFRERSETASIAIELSMQPWRAFQTDGVIMFSDILTPLPALGVEFDVIKGKGPRIDSPISSMDDVRSLLPMDDPLSKLPFVHETLSTLRSELRGTPATLLGFVGTPWTLAAYSVEGKAERNCRRTKTMMYNNPEILHALLDHLTDALIVYCGYQIEAGAQVVQLFDSWAHHLSPEQSAEFSMPYAERIIAAVRAKYPHVPLIFHANGGSGKHAQLAACSADVIGLDWECTMAGARAAIGADRTLQGNVDPMVLFGTEDEIRKAVTRCLVEAGPRRHILNVGHGVIEGTPEENVGLFCDLARQSADILAAHGKAPAAAKQPVAAHFLNSPLSARPSAMAAPPADHGHIRVLAAEVGRLENAIAKLLASNADLKAAIAAEGDDDERTFKTAIQENIVVIAKYRAQVERLQQELEELRGGWQQLGGAQAVPSQEPAAAQAAGPAGQQAQAQQQQARQGQQQSSAAEAGSGADTAMAEAEGGLQQLAACGGGMWM